MQLRPPAIADPTALLPAADAIAKVGAATILMAVAFVSRDPVTPTVLLAGEAVALAGSGLRAGDLVRLLVPLATAVSVLLADRGLRHPQGAVRGPRRRLPRGRVPGVT